MTDKEKKYIGTINAEARQQADKKGLCDGCRGIITENNRKAVCDKDLLIVCEKWYDAFRAALREAARRY